MAPETRLLKIAVLETAAELIVGYLETGLTDEELGFPSDRWKKQAHIIFTMLSKKANKLKQPSNQYSRKHRKDTQ